MEGRSKIELVRVPSNERGGNFRSVDGGRGSYNYVRVGTYYPEPEVKVVVCDSKPPIEQNRKFKKYVHHPSFLSLILAILFLTNDKITFQALGTSFEIT